MKRIVIWALCALLAFVAVPTGSSAAPASRIWVAPNTVKITKIQGPPASSQGSVNIKMAKNEYESAQVIVTAGSTAINSVTASISNLVSGANTISASDVKLYVQHYINVTVTTSGSTGDFGTGWYPDAMIPYQNYMQVKTNLSVPANSNQGLWFTFKTSSQTPAGTYTGNITITADGVNSIVPVELKVWNFSLTDETHSMSSFAIWGGDMLIAGHPGIVQNSPQYWTLMQNYYNYLLDYRVSAGKLPIPETDINAYIQQAAQYVNNPRVPSYNISYTQGDFNNGRAAQIVQGLRNAGLLNNKAFYYLGAEIDEPNPAMYPAVIDFSNKIKALDPNLRHVVTVEPVKELMGTVNTFTPLFYYLTNDYIRKMSAEHFKTPGNELWWYGCVGPQHPYPSYHIDDYTLGARVISWMQKSYGIKGNLYWAVNIYKKYVNGQYIARDIWNDPMAFSPGANGDGFLLYPGTAYNINGPIGTIRLEAIRDGNEDYEYLWTLEQKLNAAATTLGVNVKLDDIMQPLYDRLFGNVNDYSKNPEVMDSVRDEVAAMIESLDKNPKALAVFGTANTTSAQKEITVYAEQGTTVKVNGTVVNASGTVGNASKYTTSVAAVPGFNQMTLEYSKNGNTVSMVRSFIWTFYSTSSINNFDNSTELGKLSTQNGVTLSLSTQHVTQGTNALKAVIPATVQYPGFYLNVDTGLNDMRKYKTLEMDIYNESSTTQYFYGKFFNTSGQVHDRRIGFLTPGQNHVSFDLRSMPSSFNKATINQILFWLDGNNPAPINLYVDKLYLIKSGLTDINNFESAADIQRFSAQNGVTLSRSKEVVANGSNAMKAVIPATNQFPGFYINTDASFSNVYHYSSLELDVYNDSNVSQEFFVKFVNSKGQVSDRKAADLAPGKVTHVSYPLSDISSSFDKSVVSTIMFWMWGGNSQVSNLYIDNFGFIDLATTGSIYQAHVQNIGWQSWVNNEATAGTVGQNLQMEALKVMLTSPPAGAHIKYQAHVQSVGWQSWVYDGAIAGTTGQSLRMEAVKIMLEGAPAGYHVKYRAYVTNIGWQNWVLDGAIAGTTGQSLPIQAIEISVYNE
ncbi:glycoside hydrolase domain-containing protein [Cohnella silvisoli]|uniref:DUF4091 domain-containing protein n=1 Tax=Cohnella silvisoli TaxID=2873699 RepID=A0ABV1KYA6_9BACL|nr:glycoside hydrolase domain-containing protein [Cohnella silvisoli]MCD9021870.1 DUF4091 domain-containing protein [Cohnella silvisoli]